MLRDLECLDGFLAGSLSLETRPAVHERPPHLLCFCGDQLSSQLRESTIPDEGRMARGWSIFSTVSLTISLLLCFHVQMFTRGRYQGLTGVSSRVFS